MKREVAILFARTDSIYYDIEGCDVYDIKRNALNFGGGLPVIGHPPCRAWGRLSYFAKPRPGEKALAPWCIYQVRENGGILEHPAASKLWKELKLPMGGEVDKYGGYTLSVDQYWWGHRAQKTTWLYIVGIPPSQLLPMPLKFGRPTHTITSNKVKRKTAYSRPEVSLAERERTPPDFAKWLVDCARLVER